MTVSMVMSPWLPVSFSSADEAILFSVVYYGWLGCEIIGSMILPRLRQQRSGVKLERKDRGSGWMVITGVIASIFVAFFFERLECRPSFLVKISCFVHGIKKCFRDIILLTFKFPGEAHKPPFKEPVKHRFVNFILEIY